MNNLLKSKWMRLNLALVGVLLCAVTGCVFLDGYSIAQIGPDGKEVYYAKAGEEATFTVNGHIEARIQGNDGVTTNFVFAMLVPKDWEMAKYATVTYKTDLADDREKELPMVVMPSTSLPKQGGGRTWVQCLANEYGVGPNVLDDMEWVVFQTAQKWTIMNNQDPTYRIFVRTKMGRKNLKCKLGFFVSHTDDGFGDGTDHKKVVFANECFEVVGGQGMTLDFCNNHYNKVTPMAALQNDYVTISFIGDAADNLLAQSDMVYLQGEAVTTDGRVYRVDNCNEKTLMSQPNKLTKTFQLTIWPCGFFGVPTDQQIDHISYWFSNADGSIVITQSDDNFVQQGTPYPTEKELFNFVFSCE